MPVIATSKPRTVSATINHGSEQIPIEVDFGKRKRLYITVSPDQSVLVKAPVRESLQRVMEFVQHRAPWIQKHRQRFEQFKPLILAHHYVSGETLLYLGRQYRLEAIQCGEEDVKLRDSVLAVYANDPLDADHIRALLEWWYREQARVLFADRLANCFLCATQLAVDFPVLRVRHMKRSWGTCSAQGWINLNWELIKTPLECIDYVITHELCHLRHRNHSKAFYRLLGRLMPDWRQRKERLDRHVI